MDTSNLIFNREFMRNPVLALVAEGEKETQRLNTALAGFASRAKSPSFVGMSAPDKWNFAGQQLIAVDGWINSLIETRIGMHMFIFGNVGGPENHVRNLHTAIDQYLQDWKKPKGSFPVIPGMGSWFGS